MTKPMNAAALVAAALVTLTLLGHNEAGAAAGPTVGDFAVKLYKGNLPRPAAMVALQAVAPALRDPDAPLSERSLAAIMNGFGLGATTSQPGSPVDQGRADAALTFIWQSMSGPGAPGGASSGGSINLATCTVERNIWTCMQCCTSQGGPIGSCSYFCTFGVSPSSP